MTFNGRGAGLAFAAALCLSGCAAADPVETYTGYYRQGFEQQDFYTLDGDGPWLLQMDETMTKALMTHYVDKGGRGSHLTVAISFDATTAPVPDFAYSERYRGALSVTELHDAAKLDEQTWWDFTSALSAEE